MGGGRLVTPVLVALPWPSTTQESCANHSVMMCVLDQVVSPVTGRGGMQEVARLFGEAIVIVAPHGGTLGNLIFSYGSSGGVDAASVDAASVDTASVDNDAQSTIKATHVLGKATHVLELLPANRPNLCYERLCRALGIVYMGLVVPDSSYNEAMRVDVLHVLLSLHTLLQT